MKADDDTEIVIVSDTVRQRRSRTPISSTSSQRESNVVMPDVLPKPAQPKENGSNFSDVSTHEMQSREVDAGECSMVEIKERELSTKIVIRNIEFENAKVDTISIFESCSRFEPEQVETVHIIDASSDTDTAASTPLLERRSLKSLSSNRGSIDELETELQRELETVSFFEKVEDPQFDFEVKKQKISFNGHKKLKGKDRDLLRDSEVAEERAIKMMKLRPTLKELWMEERNSFYGPENDNDEEPLVFSDDEEIPRYSIEMDSDSDVVAAFANSLTFISCLIFHPFYQNSNFSNNFSLLSLNSHEWKHQTTAS